MSEWITTIVALIGVIISISLLIRSSGKKEERQKANVESLVKEVKDIRDDFNQQLCQLNEAVTETKHIIGNGGYHGIRQDVQQIKEHCAAEMAKSVSERKSLFKELDEIKNKMDGRK